MQGRRVRDRGARAVPGYAIWPYERQNARIVRSASLAGEHTLTGYGVPANMPKVKAGRGAYTRVTQRGG